MNLSRLLALAAAALLALSAPALAQPVQAPIVSAINPTDAFLDQPNGYGTTTDVFATAKQLQGFVLGGNVVRSAEKPVLTGCITGGGTIAGSDNAFILTGGSSASTSCVATFPTAYVSTPVCSVTSQTAYATTTPSYTVSTTAVTITQSSQSSEVYDVICVAQPGG
jgi:hypothetical protein